MRLTKKRSGVSALISTLLLVAIAVTLSVALFVSTTGYLSGLTSSIGNAQPGQNRAAQTIISIENTVSKAYTTNFTSNPSNGYVELFVRNVGGVSLTLGSVAVTAPPTNGGQNKSFLSVLSAGTWSTPSVRNVVVCSEATNETSCETSLACKSSASPLTQLTSQQNTAKIWIEWCSHPTGSPVPESGDAFQIQVSSTVGASNIITINVP